MSDTQSC